MEERCKADHELELKCDQTSVTWCPSHDLIAIFSQVSHLLEVYRIEAELDKVVSAQVNSQPTALEFVRHGRYLVVGDTQGRVSVLKSDTLDEVKSFVLDDSTASITALTW